MTLNEQISAELKIAMKSGDAKTTGLLRFLMAQIQNKTKEKFGAKEGVLSDEEVLDVLKREAKKRKEAINLFEQGGRKDLADKEKEELALMGKYLPAELGKDEIRRVVKEVISLGASDFGRTMKEAMARLKGQADGKLVSEIIKEELG